MIRVFLLSTNQLGAALEVLQGLQLLFTEVKWPFSKALSFVFFFKAEKPPALPPSSRLGDAARLALDPSC